MFSSAPLLCSQQKTELPVTENVQTIPPPYVVRTILVYSRPPCQPQFSLTEPMKVTGAWVRVVRRREGFLSAGLGTAWRVPGVSGGSGGLWSPGTGSLSLRGWCSLPAENVPVSVFLLRRCLHPQWRRREGGGDELEGEALAGVGGRWGWMGCLRTHPPRVSGIPTSGSWSFGYLTTISTWSAGSSGGLLGQGACFSLSLLLPWLGPLLGAPFPPCLPRLRWTFPSQP